MTEYRKKLIEVALPLEAINRASAHEKSVPRKGHPATTHLWWARRPLAACRAVLFASLVDDPSAHPDQFPDDEAQQAERLRLFAIIEELVKWENASNESVLDAARAEIQRSTGGNPPPVVDPFCGGGSIPLEAQRLGLDAYASDLNPVAVLITKALIEIPPKFVGLPPVNPDANAKLGDKGWRNAEGLADDVRHYGLWMRDEAERRVGRLYPNVTLPESRGGGQATVIAWLWARTVTCPNPACKAEMPLLTSLVLSSKKGRECYLIPIVEGTQVTFDVHSSPPQGIDAKKGFKRGMSGVFQCAVCGDVTTRDYIASEGEAGRIGRMPTATVAQGVGGRVYLPADASAKPVNMPSVEDIDGLDVELAANPRDVWCRNFGLTTPRSLFTDRQLVTLSTLSDLIAEVRQQVEKDVTAHDHAAVRADGYADAVCTFLAFAVDKLADWSSTVCSWIHSIQGVRDTFARQAIPMVWDYVEINPFSESVGNFLNHVEWVSCGVAGLVAGTPGTVTQLDGTRATPHPGPALVCTDPPYYDNIAYADLSDFFFVWLRRALRHIYADLFSTVLTPKSPELVAAPFRFGGDSRRAKAFFEEGLFQAFSQMLGISGPDYPTTVFYAFKQAESRGADDSRVSSTGWETMLGGLLAAGYAITGTWPMRSERSGRTISVGTNALASSVVLVCRPRPASASLATRKEFIGALRSELPDALRKLQDGNIAPVDLAQASIGPGMAVFSRYARVVEGDASPMTVRTALALINDALDEILAEQEGEFDADTRWAISWYGESGLDAGEFGRAELLSRAKNTSVEGMVQAGIVEARGGKVRLLHRDELDEAWDPTTDKRLTVWEMTQHLIRRLDQGESAAAALARQLGSYAEVARDLAYRLYVICERKKWSMEGQAYNGLVVSWPSIMQLAAAEPGPTGPSQTSFEV